MATQISKFIELTATQGGIDAFVESSASTNIIPADGMGLEIDKIVFAFRDNGQVQSIGSDCSFSISLTRDTKAAIPNLTDNDVFFLWGFANSFTTSGQALIPLVHEWTPPKGLLLVEPTIYMQLDGLSTSIAFTVDARIYYNEVKVSEVEILRLLNNV